MDWQNFMNDLAALLAEATNPDRQDWAAFFTALAALLAEASDHIPAPAEKAHAKLVSALPTANEPTARDWAGFFAALAQFAQVLFPLIAPFLKPQTATK